MLNSNKPFFINIDILEAMHNNKVLWYFFMEKVHGFLYFGKMVIKLAVKKSAIAWKNALFRIFNLLFRWATICRPGLAFVVSKNTLMNVTSPIQCLDFVWKVRRRVSVKTTHMCVRGIQRRALREQLCRPFLSL